ncbi:MAG TPA: DUF6340 family protein [Bacteroidales bacterium]|nr:DUF6340 family protein [Bacteroidales bacterium]HPT12288.1 DUF6340 family protein [Bacteroidales bacterium]
MKRIIFILMVALAVTSCKTQQVFIYVKHPAPVTVPPDIKSIGIIDRTSPTKETESIDKLDRIVSLEGPKLDSVGKRGALQGLSDELLADGKITEVKDLTAIDFRTSSMGNFPNPLSWDIVESVCNENNTNAIFSLELYDTDTRILHVPYTQGDAKEKLLAAVLEPNTSIETFVTMGWRIYDPRDKAIRDEFTITRSIVNSGSLASTAIAMTGRREAVKNVSVIAGRDYATRLLPYDITLTRDYYVKGSSNFKIAKRKAQNGKWDEAGQLWEKETTNPSSKIAGRAVYNMAIINEINGNLDEAIKWAEKAYEDYGIKLGRDYVPILRDRLRDQELLNYQEGR